MRPVNQLSHHFEKKKSDQHFDSCSYFLIYKKYLVLRYSVKMLPEAKFRVVINRFTIWNESSVRAFSFVNEIICEIKK